MDISIDIKMAQASAWPVGLGCESSKRPASRARFSVGLACVLMGILGSTATRAGESSATFTVSATIAKQARIASTSQVKPLTLTAADIALGYVDVKDPVSISIQSNSRSGFILTLSSEASFIRQTIVKGLGADIQMDGPVGSVILGADEKKVGLFKNEWSMTFRFVLSPDAKPGVYAWPVQLSVESV